MGFVGAYVDRAALTQTVCDDPGFFNIRHKQAAMFTGGQLASIGATTKLGQAASTFIQLLTSVDAESAMARLNLAVPALIAATNSDLVTSNPASQFSATHLGDSVYDGGNAGWLRARCLRPGSGQGHPWPEHAPVSARPLPMGDLICQTERVQFTNRGATDMTNASTAALRFTTASGKRLFSAPSGGPG